MGVNGCGVLPSAFMTQTWLRGRQQLVPNRIRVPSGDQSGLPASILGSVSRLTAPPFAFITQTALVNPPRLLAKAILCPLGEYSGTWLIQFPPSSFQARPVGVHHVQVAELGEAGEDGAVGEHDIAAVRGP